MNFCLGLDFIVLTTLTLVSSCLHTGAAREVTSLNNEFCRIRPTLVAIDHPSYRHYPYYVTLYRCGGTISFISPRFKTCVPKTIQDIKILARNLETGQPIVINEKNHTSCKDGCTNSKAMCDTEMEEWSEERCRCECKYPNGPPTPCPARFRWSGYTCSCQCNEEEHSTQCLREEKLWSKDKCGCECSPRVITRCKKLDMVVDERTCHCVRGNVLFGAQTGEDKGTGISKPMLIGIVFGELLLLLLIFDLFLHTKQWGCTYYLRKSVGKAVSRDSQKSSPLSPRSNHDRTTYL